jgi:hypothetical protein
MKAATRRRPLFLVWIQGMNELIFIDSCSPRRNQVGYRIAHSTSLQGISHQIIRRAIVHSVNQSKNSATHSEAMDPGWSSYLMLPPQIVRPSHR